MFDHNYPTSQRAIAILQSGLTYLKKEAEIRNCNWLDFITQLNENQWSVMGRGGEFYAIVDTQYDTCNCLSQGYCWHKAIVACLLKGTLPAFDHETTSIVTSKIREEQLYELFIIFDGHPVSVKNFKRPLDYWKPMIKKTLNKSQLLLRPETKEAKELLHEHI